MKRKPVKSSAVGGNKGHPARPGKGDDMYVLLMMKNSVNHPEQIICHDRLPHGPMVLPGDVCIDVTDLIPDGIDPEANSNAYTLPEITALRFWYAAVVGIPPEDVRCIHRHYPQESVWIK